MNKFTLAIMISVLSLPSIAKTVIKFTEKKDPITDEINKTIMIANKEKCTRFKCPHIFIDSSGRMAIEFSGIIGKAMESNVNITYRVDDNVPVTIVAIKGNLAKLAAIHTEQAKPMIEAMKVGMKIVVRADESTLNTESFGLDGFTKEVNKLNLKVTPSLLELHSQNGN